MPNTFDKTKSLSVDNVRLNNGTAQIHKMSEIEYVVVIEGKSIKSYKTKREAMAFLDGFNYSILEGVSQSEQ